MSGRLRSFVAVNLPASLRDTIAAGIARARGGAGGLRWVAAEQLHLTLRFLGEVTPELVDEIGRDLGERLAPLAPFDVRFSGAGAFPSGARARVVWVGADRGSEQLRELADAAERAAVSAGLPPERHRFEPHLTVARVRSLPADPAVLQRLLERLRQQRWGGFVVPSVHVMRSELFPGGPRYSILRELTLPSRQAEGPRR